jgi:5-methyltetrahydrofolate--homocysteine methyltransferase
MTSDIVLGELTTDDLWVLLQEDLYDGLNEAVVAEVEEALARGEHPQTILQKGLIAGMETVSADFRNGVIFVPEVLVAANAMKAGLTVLQPYLTRSESPPIGTVVIGTVRGDIHDIGKNIVAMMLEGAGFEVINLGKNVAVEQFMAAVEAHHAHILGMSALLTTSMPYMKEVIDALVARGLRDRVIVLVGGAPLNEVYAREFGADAYCRDAYEAVHTARRLLHTRLRGDHESG